MDFEKLLLELEDKNEKLNQAGKYGKSLLDTIAHLEEQLQQANTDYEEKSEELEQYKYTAEMKLEASKCCEEQLRTNWQDEKKVLSDIYREELDIQRKCHEEELSESNKKIFDLQKENEEKSMVNAQLNEKIKALQSSVSELRISLQKKSVSCSVPELDALTNENSELYQQLTRAKEETVDMQSENERLRHQVEDLQKCNECFREAKENIRREMAECSEALELTQLEKLNLTRELAELKTQPQDINNRGNSLFAEVEDRRVLAEKKLISSQVKLKCMEKKYTQQVNYALKLKSQIAQLLQTGGRDADRERISRLEQALTSSQYDVELRNDKIADLEKKAALNLNDTVNEMKKSANGDGNFVGFLENLLKKKDTEITKLSKELQNCHIDLLAESRKLNDAEVDVYAAQNERDKLKAQAVKLKMEVTRLKMKCGENVQGMRHVKPRKIEEIPTEPTAVLSQSNCVNNENIPMRPHKTTVLEKPVNAGISKNNDLKSETKTNDSKHGLKQCPEECRQQ